MPEIIAIRKDHSLDFVRQVFAAYNTESVVALVADDPGGDPGVAGLTPYFPTEIITPNSGGGWLDVKQPLFDSTGPAQIVFTSGTEGRTKPIVISHRALSDVVRRLNSFMQLDESIREYVGIPVTYSFGLARCRAVAAVGGKCFLPEYGFDIIELLEMLAAEQINAISTVPTIWRAVLQKPEMIGHLGENIRWMEIGSQYMTATEKMQLRELFPNARIVQHYGLTEASRTSLLMINETTEALLDSVGQTCGDTQVRISNAGHIQIKGPHLADGQLLNGELIPLCHKDGWFETNDLGSMREGYLYYQGRSDDQINCGGIMVDPERLQQSVCERLNAAQQLAICGIPDGVRGEGFFVAIDARSVLEISRVKATVEYCLEIMDIHATSSISIQKVENIPRTATGKVKRRQLARLCE